MEYALQSATEDSLCSYDDNLSCLDNLLPLSKYAHPSDEAISFHLMRESSMHSPTFAEDFPHRSEESNQVQPVLSNNASDIQPGYQGIRCIADMLMYNTFVANK